MDADGNGLFNMIIKIFETHTAFVMLKQVVWADFRQLNWFYILGIVFMCNSDNYCLQC